MLTRNVPSKLTAKTLNGYLAALCLTASIIMTDTASAQTVSPPAGLDNMTIEETRVMANELGAVNIGVLESGRCRRWKVRTKSDS